MTRSQYIDIEELNEITGSEFDNNSKTIRIINEASEALKQHCFKWKFKAPDFDYSIEDAPDELKLATAYQVLYQEELVDEYASGSQSVSIGRTSETRQYGGNGTQEWQKISPKAHKYLIDGGLLSRII